MEQRYNRRSAGALSGALLVLGTLVAPAAAQQLFRYTDQEIDPELESWEVEVDLGLIRTGASGFAIVPPSGESIAVELSRFEERENGNALWVGRVVREAQDTLQFTLHDGYLVGSYTGTTAKQFSLRARPDGSGRVELRELPEEHSCGLDDDHLTEILTPPPCDEGALVCFEEDADGLAVTSGRGRVDVAGANALHNLSVLPLVTPDAVYHWESTTGSNTEAEIVALYDFANLVFSNNDLPARITAPPEATGADGQPRPIWAPLTLLNDQDSSRDYPWQLFRHSAASASLRSRFGADLVQLFYYNPDPLEWCGIADQIWRSDAGMPRTARDVAPSHTMSQTNVSCRGSDAVFVHEMGHLLGAMHDGVVGGSHGCAAGGAAYSCDAYGYFLNVDYSSCPAPLVPPFDPWAETGTIMAYAGERVPFFSTTRVAPPPTLGGLICPSPRVGNNEAVLRVTAPEAAFFDEYLPTSPPVDVKVTLSSDMALIHFNWRHLPAVRGDLEIFYTQDADFFEDFTDRGGGWRRLPGPYTGDQQTGVSVDRPTGLTPATHFYGFVVCLTHNRDRVCSDLAVLDDRTWKGVFRPTGVVVQPSETVPNLVSVQWDDISNDEDGYKVQVRAGSGPWQEPDERVQPHGHVRSHHTGSVLARAYLWDLDKVGTRNEGVLEFRVCAVKQWADDACSDTVSLHRSEVSEALVAPYYSGEGGVIGVAAGAVTVTTRCRSDGVTISRMFPADEWNNVGHTPGGDPRPAHAFNLRDYFLHCTGPGELTVDGLAPGAWYYTRNDPPTAAPLLPVSALTGRGPAIPVGLSVAAQSGGTWFRLGNSAPNWASTIISHVAIGSGPLVAPYYGGDGGVIGVAAGDVTVTTRCRSDGVTISRMFPADEWNNAGHTPGGDPRPAHAFNLRDYDLACRGEGELTVDGLGPGAWYYTRNDPPTAAPLFPASALTGPRPAHPSGVFVDEQPGGTWFRLGAASPNWASTIIPHVH